MESGEAAVKSSEEGKGTGVGERPAVTSSEEGKGARPSHQGFLKKDWVFPHLFGCLVSQSVG